MSNQHDFKIDGVEVLLWLDSKTWKWKVYFTSNPKFNEPALVFTKAKGKAILEFLENLKARTH